MSVGQKLELGNYYAANKLWRPAADAFGSALALLDSKVGPGELLSPVPHLESALKAMCHTACDLSSRPAPPALLGLRDAQAKAHPELGVDRARYLSAFRDPRIPRWIVAYHQKWDDIGFPDHPIPHPSDDPVAFFLDTRELPLRSAPLSANVIAQLSYALSHRAWANVSIAIELYTVGKVLIADGCSAIHDAAGGYDRALLLRPSSSWALAHRGEAYRNMANSWPPSMEGITTPGNRVNDYVTALLYFRAAIRLDPDDFWAHAHLGATIVNVRAFAGRLDKQGKVPELDGLLENWLGGRSAEQQEHDFLKLAMECLNKAQQLRGNFYPWAQLYAANVLLIWSVMGKQSVQAQEAGTLGGVLTLDAIGLQPELAGNLFEPGELYDNPLYQFGLLYLWCKKYLPAWRYVCLGMSRNFKFRFLPGLDVFLGYQLLANVWDWQLVNPQCEQNDGMPFIDYMDYVPRELPVPVRPKPTACRDDLIYFIADVFMKVCRPMVDAYIEYQSSTSIHVSLLQVCFTLVNLQQILNRAGGSGPAKQKAEEVRRDMRVCIETILQPVNLCFEPNLFDIIQYDQEHGVELLFTHVYSDGLSYQMAKTLHKA